MKKPLAFLLAVVLIVSMVLPASAAGAPTISISSGEVKAGETVELTVSIQNNPGIAATILYLYYDTDAFEMNEYSDITLLGDFRSIGSFIGNPIATAKSNGNYHGEVSSDGMLILWFHQKGLDTTANGEMLKVRLKAKADAANGPHVIRVVPMAEDTCDSTGTPVDVQSGRGTITVSGGSDEKKPQAVIEGTAFSDISGSWAESYIWQAANLGLVEGYQGLYRPNDTMTRAEFVTILWRSQGEPAPAGKASFTDLTQDWYKTAVAWAEENKIVDGVGNGKFAPTAPVTREQLVTILHRLAGNPMGMELMLGSLYDGQYSDSGQIGSWAKMALYWSVYKGIYCGEQSVDIGTSLAPKANASRAQIAVMMVNYLDKVQ